MQKATLLLVTALATASAYAETQTGIRVPREHFKKTMTAHGNLLEKKYDLMGDGKEVVFLAYDDDTNGRLGYMWSTYVPDRAEYVTSDEMISFYPEMAYYGRVDGIKEKALIVYSGGGGRSSTELTRIEVREKKVIEVPFKTIHWNKASDRAFFLKLFKQVPFDE